jgi:hypothetical protein
MALKDWNKTSQKNHWQNSKSLDTIGVGKSLQSGKIEFRYSEYGSISTYDERKVFSSEAKAISYAKQFMRKN